MQWVPKKKASIWTANFYKMYEFFNGQLKSQKYL